MLRLRCTVSFAAGLPHLHDEGRGIGLRARAPCYPWRPGLRVWRWTGDSAVPSAEGVVADVHRGVAWVRWLNGDDAGMLEPVQPADISVRPQGPVVIRRQKG